jgi:hypothetical protein
MIVRGRVEQLESSYSEILSLLKQNTAATRAPETTAASSTPALTEASRRSHATDLTSPLVPEPMDGSGTDWIGIPLDECELLISDFRRMSTNHFPWVVIPEACPAAILIEERPMLAQAVFIVTCGRAPARQQALKERFLKDFSERYFVKSERSLDMLQSVMVYFGW